MSQEFIIQAATPSGRQIGEPYFSENDGPPRVTESDIVDKDPSKHRPSSSVRSGSTAISVISQVTVSNGERRGRSRMRKEGSARRSRVDVDPERCERTSSPKMVISRKTDAEEIETIYDCVPKEEAADVISVVKQSDVGDSVTKDDGDGEGGIQLHPPLASKRWNYKFLARARRRLTRRIEHNGRDQIASKNEIDEEEKPVVNSLDEDKTVTELETNTDTAEHEAPTEPEVAFNPGAVFDLPVVLIRERCTILPEESANKFDELVQLMALVPKPYNENQARAATRTGYASEKCGYYQDRTDPLARPIVERSVLSDSAVGLLAQHTEAIPLQRALRRRKFREIIGSLRKWYSRSYLYKQSLKRVKPKKRRNTLIFVQPKDDIYIPEHGYVLTTHGYSGDNSDADNTRVDLNRKKKDPKDRIYKRYPTVRLPDFPNKPTLNIISDTSTLTHFTLEEDSNDTSSTSEISDTSSSEDEKRFITVPETGQEETEQPPSAKNVIIIPLDLINYAASPIIQEKVTWRGKIRKMASRASKFLNKWSCRCIGKKNKNADSNGVKDEYDMCIVSVEGDIEDDSYITSSSLSSYTTC